MKRASYAITLGALAIGLLLFALCHRPSRQYRTLAGAAWGTTYHITYCSDRDLSDAIIAAINSIDASLSPFNDTSTITRINRNISNLTDEKFREVFAISQHVCSISGGAFDPTVAPLINLWGFGYADSVSAPDSTQIALALQRVGILDCSISPQGLIIKKTPFTEFNFSAVAKGYGVDQVAKALRENGCNDYMVEIGGEVALAGKNPRNKNWRIQIDAPDRDLSGTIEHNRLEVLELSDCCIATSGNYRNFRSTPDGIIGHTISPATGKPIATRTLSATIIAPSCAIADALATAVMAMPDSAAIAMINEAGVSAILVTADPDSTYSVTTHNFQ